MKVLLILSDAVEIRCQTRSLVQVERTIIENSVLLVHSEAETKKYSNNINGTEATQRKREGFSYNSDYISESLCGFGSVREQIKSDRRVKVITCMNAAADWLQGAVQDIGSCPATSMHKDMSNTKSDMKLENSSSDCYIRLGECFNVQECICVLCVFMCLCKMLNLASSFYFLDGITLITCYYLDNGLFSNLPFHQDVMFGCSIF